MARIAGVDIPNDKRVVISLTYIYGIGLTTSKKVLEEAGISEDVRVKDLTEEQLNAIRKTIDAIKVEGDLRREVQLNIKRLMEIGCYRGMRHSKEWQKYKRHVKDVLKRILREDVHTFTRLSIIQS